MTALAAALQVPFDARRAERNHIRRGRSRVNAVRDGGGSNGHRRIDLTDHVLIIRLRDHLGLTSTAIGALLGDRPHDRQPRDRTARQLLTDHGIPLPPAAERPAIRIRTINDLREYAARHGIAIPLRPPEPTLPQMAQ